MARIAASHACALTLGLLADRQTAPDALVTACRRHQVCLLTLPVDVPFTAVSEAMADLMAGARQRELLATINRGDALARAVSGGAGELRVFELLTAEVDLPVALVDAAGHVLAASGLDGRDLDAPVIADALQGPQQVDLTFPDGLTASVFRIGGLERTDAALVCLEPFMDLAASDRAALEQTARFLTVELTRRHALQAIEARFAAELIEMVFDPTRRGAELPARLRPFGIDPDGPLVALSVAFADGDVRTAPGLSDIIAQELRRHGGPAVVPEGSDDAVALVGWPHRSEDLLAAVHATAERLAREWPARRPVVGVGRVVRDFRELRVTLVEAREARRVAERRRRGPAVAAFDHVGSHLMLMAMHEPHLLQAFADAVLKEVRDYDRDHRSDLEHTLRAFLDAGGRFAQAAAALHVHVNTLRNRLTRIEELTSRDLASTEDRVDLYLALAVGQLE